MVRATKMTMRAGGISLLACALAGLVPDAGPAQGPVRVEVQKIATGYQLVRDGRPYRVRGAGLEYGDVASLAAHGGNSIRTWTTDDGVRTARQVLDEAHAHGVTVALCLPVLSEHHGFDYGDAAAVAAQLRRMRAEVLRYRDHPALLAWIIGNELNFRYTTPAVYDAVNDISRMIHGLDPNHPTTTTLAGLDAGVVDDVLTRAPDLDFVSFQVYGQLFILPEFLEQIGYDRPFFVTEWGAVGWWEVEKTPWGAPVEADSTAKAGIYRRGWTEKLEPLQDRLIGSYVFLWGQKQERTPTWFGLFTEAGEETEAVDVMHRIWNGEWPANRAPRVASMLLDGRRATDGIELVAGQRVAASVDVTDPDGDALAYRWELKPESSATQIGGAFEKSILNVDGAIDDPAAATVRVTAPSPGAYRLFVYAYDGHGHAAHANIPFLVAGDSAPR